MAAIHHLGGFLKNFFILPFWFVSPSYSLTPISSSFLSPPPNSPQWPRSLGLQPPLCVGGLSTSHPSVGCWEDGEIQVLINTGPSEGEAWIPGSCLNFWPGRLAGSLATLLLLDEAASGGTAA